MFEKEAEEYANQSCFTEMPNPSLSESIDISDDIKDAVMFGYNKANEWHYVKDGDLPKYNDEKLCFHGTGTVVAKYDSEYGCWETYFNNLETVIPSSVVIAWKEIVLPELPKENE